ncbi:MAG: hypothetical protein LBU04_07795, partial [Christensenellaceae bacterium]|nr:hypothetical protein [Christensenellaceae bacterium]
MSGIKGLLDDETSNAHRLTEAGIDYGNGVFVSGVASDVVAKIITTITNAISAEYDYGRTINGKENQADVERLKTLVKIFCPKGIAALIALDPQKVEILNKDGTVKETIDVKQDDLFNLSDKYATLLYNAFNTGTGNAYEKIQSLIYGDGAYLTPIQSKQFINNYKNFLEKHVALGQTDALALLYSASLDSKVSKLEKEVQMLAEEINAIANTSFSDLANLIAQQGEKLYGANLEYQREILYDCEYPTYVYENTDAFRDTILAKLSRELSSKMKVDTVKNSSGRYDVYIDVREEGNPEPVWKKKAEWDGTNAYIIFDTTGKLYTKEADAIYTDAVKRLLFPDHKDFADEIDLEKESAALGEDALNYGNIFSGSMWAELMSNQELYFYILEHAADFQKLQDLRGEIAAAVTYLRNLAYVTIDTSLTTKSKGTTLDIKEVRSAWATACSDVGSTSISSGEAGEFDSATTDKKDQLKEEIRNSANFSITISSIFEGANKEKYNRITELLKEASDLNSENIAALYQEAYRLVSEVASDVIKNQNDNRLLVADASVAPGTSLRFDSGGETSSYNKISWDTVSSWDELKKYLENKMNVSKADEELNFDLLANVNLSLSMGYTDSFKYGGTVANKTCGGVGWIVLYAVDRKVSVSGSIVQNNLSASAKTTRENLKNFLNTYQGNFSEIELIENQEWYKEFKRKTIEYQGKANFDANEQNEWSLLTAALRSESLGTDENGKPIYFTDGEIENLVFYIRAEANGTPLSQSRQNQYEELKARAKKAGYTVTVFTTQDSSLAGRTETTSVTTTYTGDALWSRMLALGKKAKKNYETLKSDYDYLLGAWNANKKIFAQFEGVVNRIKEEYEKKKAELDALKAGGAETAKQSFTFLQESLGREYFIISAMAKIINGADNTNSIAQNGRGYQISGQIGQIQTSHRITNIKGSTSAQNLFRTISIVAEKVLDTGNATFVIGQDADGEDVSIANFKTIVFDSVTEQGGAIVEQENGLKYRIFGVIRDYQGQEVVWEYQGSYGDSGKFESYLNEKSSLEDQLAKFNEERNTLNYLSSYDAFKSALDNYQDAKDKKQEADVKVTELIKKLEFASDSESKKARIKALIFKYIDDKITEFDDKTELKSLMDELSQEQKDELASAVVKAQEKGSNFKAATEPISAFVKIINTYNKELNLTEDMLKSVVDNMKLIDERSNKSAGDKALFKQYEDQIRTWAKSVLPHIESRIQTAEDSIHSIWLTNEQEKYSYDEFAPATPELNRQEAKEQMLSIEKEIIKYELLLAGIEEGDVDTEASINNLLKKHRTDLANIKNKIINQDPFVANIFLLNGSQKITQEKNDVNSDVINNESKTNALMVFLNTTKYDFDQTLTDDEKKQYVTYTRAVIIEDENGWTASGAGSCITLMQFRGSGDGVYDPHIVGYGTVAFKGSTIESVVMPDDAQGIEDAVKVLIDIQSGFASYYGNWSSPGAIWKFNDKNTKEEVDKYLKVAILNELQGDEENGKYIKGIKEIGLSFNYKTSVFFGSFTAASALVEGCGYIQLEVADGFRISAESTNDMADCIVRSETALLQVTYSGAFKYETMGEVDIEIDLASTGTWEIAMSAYEENVASYDNEIDNYKAHIEALRRYIQAVLNGTANETNSAMFTKSRYIKDSDGNMEYYTDPSINPSTGRENYNYNYRAIQAFIAKFTPYKGAIIGFFDSVPEETTQKTAAAQKLIEWFESRITDATNNKKNTMSSQNITQSTLESKNPITTLGNGKEFSAYNALAQMGAIITNKIKVDMAVGTDKYSNTVYGSFNEHSLVVELKYAVQDGVVLENQVEAVLKYDIFASLTAYGFTNVSRWGTFGGDTVIIKAGCMVDLTFRKDKKTDANGESEKMPVAQYDKNGNEIRDENGDIVYQRDENGNIIMEEVEEELIFTINFKNAEVRVSSLIISCDSALYAGEITAPDAVYSYRKSDTGGASNDNSAIDSEIRDHFIGTVGSANRGRSYSLTGTFYNINTNGSLSLSALSGSVYKYGSYLYRGSYAPPTKDEKTGEMILETQYTQADTEVLAHGKLNYKYKASFWDNLGAMFVSMGAMLLQAVTNPRMLLLVAAAICVIAILTVVTGGGALFILGMALLAVVAVALMNAFVPGFANWLAEGQFAGTEDAVAFMTKLYQEMTTGVVNHGISTQGLRSLNQAGVALFVSGALALLVLIATVALAIVTGGAAGPIVATIAGALSFLSTVLAVQTISSMMFNAMQAMVAAANDPDGFDAEKFFVEGVLMMFLAIGIAALTMFGGCGIGNSIAGMVGKSIAASIAKVVLVALAVGLLSFSVNAVITLVKHIKNGTSLDIREWDSDELYELLISFITGFISGLSIGAQFAAASNVADDLATKFASELDNIADDVADEVASEVSGKVLSLTAVKQFKTLHGIMGNIKKFFIAVFKGVGTYGAFNTVKSVIGTIIKLAFAAYINYESAKAFVNASRSGNWREALAVALVMGITAFMDCVSVIGNATQQAHQMTEKIMEDTAQGIGEVLDQIKESLLAVAGFGKNVSGDGFTWTLEQFLKNIGAILLSTALGMVVGLIINQVNKADLITFKEVQNADGTTSLTIENSYATALIIGAVAGAMLGMAIASTATQYNSQMASEKIFNFKDKVKHLFGELWKTLKTAAKSFSQNNFNMMMRMLGFQVTLNLGARFLGIIIGGFARIGGEQAAQSVGNFFQNNVVFAWFDNFSGLGIFTGMAEGAIDPNRDITPEVEDIFVTATNNLGSVQIFIFSLGTTFLGPILKTILMNIPILGQLMALFGALSETTFMQNNSVLNTAFEEGIKENIAGLFIVEIAGSDSQMGEMLQEMFDDTPDADVSSALNFMFDTQCNTDVLINITKSGGSKGVKYGDLAVNETKRKQFVDNVKNQLKLSEIAAQRLELQIMNGNITSESEARQYIAKLCAADFAANQLSLISDAELMAAYPNALSVAEAREMKHKDEFNKAISLLNNVNPQHGGVNQMSMKQYLDYLGGIALLNGDIATSGIIKINGDGSITIDRYLLRQHIDKITSDTADANSVEKIKRLQMALINIAYGSIGEIDFKDGKAKQSFSDAAATAVFFLTQLDKQVVNSNSLAIKEYDNSPASVIRRFALSQTAEIVFGFLKETSIYAQRNYADEISQMQAEIDANNDTIKTLTKEIAIIEAKKQYISYFLELQVKTRGISEIDNQANESRKTYSTVFDKYKEMKDNPYVDASKLLEVENEINKAKEVLDEAEELLTETRKAIDDLEKQIKTLLATNKDSLQEVSVTGTDQDLENQINELQEQAVQLQSEIDKLETENTNILKQQDDIEPLAQIQAKEIADFYVSVVVTLAMISDNLNAMSKRAKTDHFYHGNASPYTKIYKSNEGLKARTTIRENEKAISDMQAEIEELNKLHHERELVFEEFQRTNNLDGIKDINKEVEALDAKIKDLENKCEQLKLENEQLKSKISKIAEFEAEIEETKKTIKAIKAESEHISKQLGNKKAELQKITNEDGSINENNRDRAEELENEIKILTAKLTEYDAVLKTLNTRNKYLEEEAIPREESKARGALNDKIDAIFVLLENGEITQEEFRAIFTASDNEFYSQYSVFTENVDMSKVTKIREEIKKLIKEDIKSQKQEIYQLKQEGLIDAGTYRNLIDTLGNFGNFEYNSPMDYLLQIETINFSYANIPGIANSSEYGATKKEADRNRLNKVESLLIVALEKAGVDKATIDKFLAKIKDSTPLEVANLVEEYTVKKSENSESYMIILEYSTIYNALVSDGYYAKFIESNINKLFATFDGKIAEAEDAKKNFSAYTEFLSTELLSERGDNAFSSNGSEFRNKIEFFLKKFGIKTFTAEQTNIIHLLSMIVLARANSKNPSFVDTSGRLTKIIEPDPANPVLSEANYKIVKDAAEELEIAIQNALTSSHIDNALKKFKSKIQGIYVLTENFEQTLNLLIAAREAELASILQQSATYSYAASLALESGNINMYNKIMSLKIIIGLGTIDNKRVQLETSVSQYINMQLTFQADDRVDQIQSEIDAQEQELAQLQAQGQEMVVSNAKSSSAVSNDTEIDRKREELRKEEEETEEKLKKLEDAYAAANENPLSAVDPVVSQAAQQEYEKALSEAEQEYEKKMYDIKAEERRLKKEYENAVDKAKAAFEQAAQEYSELNKGSTNEMSLFIAYFAAVAKANAEYEESLKAIENDTSLSDEDKEKKRMEAAKSRDEDIAGKKAHFITTNEISEEVLAKMQAIEDEKLATLKKLEEDYRKSLEDIDDKLKVLKERRVSLEETLKNAFEAYNKNLEEIDRQITEIRKKVTEYNNLKIELNNIEFILKTESDEAKKNKLQTDIKKIKAKLSAMTIEVENILSSDASGFTVGGASVSRLLNNLVLQYFNGNINMSELERNVRNTSKELENTIRKESDNKREETLVQIESINEEARGLERELEAVHKKYKNTVRDIENKKYEVYGSVPWRSSTQYKEAKKARDEAIEAAKLELNKATEDLAQRRADVEKERKNKIATINSELEAVNGGAGWRKIYDDARRNYEHDLKVIRKQEKNLNALGNSSAVRNNPSNKKEIQEKKNAIKKLKKNAKNERKINKAAKKQIRFTRNETVSLNTLDTFANTFVQSNFESADVAANDLRARNDSIARMESNESLLNGIVNLANVLSNNGIVLSDFNALKNAKNASDVDPKELQNAILRDFRSTIEDFAFYGSTKNGQKMATNLSALFYQLQVLMSAAVNNKRNAKTEKEAAAAETEIAEIEAVIRYANESILMSTMNMINNKYYKKDQSIGDVLAALETQSNSEGGLSIEDTRIFNSLQFAMSEVGTNSSDILEFKQGSYCDFVNNNSKAALKIMNVNFVLNYWENLDNAVIGYIDSNSEKVVEILEKELAELNEKVASMSEGAEKKGIIARIALLESIIAMLRTKDSSGISESDKKLFYLTATQVCTINSGDFAIATELKARMISEAFGAGKTDKNLTESERLALNIKVSEISNSIFTPGSLYAAIKPGSDIWSSMTNTSSEALVVYVGVGMLGALNGKNVLNQELMFLQNLLGRVSAVSAGGGKTFVN